MAGTPADCVRLALHHLLPGVSWVLAGINRGGNLGTDVYHSGTVAAVREGSFTECRESPFRITSHAAVQSTGLARHDGPARCPRLL